MSDLFPLITLQPVSDARSAWVALLLESLPAPGSGDLTRIFDEFGLTEALGPLPCIVTLPDLAAVIEPLPSDRIVLRLPAGYCCDRANDESLRLAQAGGFRLMADGLPGADQTLGEVIHGLSLPCPDASSLASAGSLLTSLPGPHLALSRDEASCPGHCRFQWFSGYAPVHAAVVPVKGRDAPNRTHLLDLLAKVVNDADTHEIEAVIKRDPQLSYHLLRLVNSVAFAPTKKIGSFNQAIALLGRRQLQRWLQLLLYASARNDDTANALLPRAAMRAGLAEALCARAGGSQDAQDRAFMVGMFSLLDALFGIPLAEIVGPLNLADEVVSALVTRSGPLSHLLNAVEAGEKAPNGALVSLLGEMGTSHEVWGRAVIHACRWAVQISGEA